MKIRLCAPSTARSATDAIGRGMAKSSAEADPVANWNATAVPPARTATDRAARTHRFEIETPP